MHRGQLRVVVLDHHPRSVFCGRQEGKNDIALLTVKGCIMNGFSEWNCLIYQSCMCNCASLCVTCHVTVDELGFDWSAAIHVYVILS